jgi:hypothetical protein
MIERLAIHRFRGIREGEVKDIGKFNVLIGPNNSGKTAILEMLYLGGLSSRSCNVIIDGAGSESIIFTATTTTTRDFLEYEPLPRLRRRHGHKEQWEESPAALDQQGGLEITLRDVPETFSMHDFRLGSEEKNGEDGKVFLENDPKQVTMFSLRGQSGLPADMIPRFFEKKNIRSEEMSWHFLWQSDLVYRWERNNSGIDQVAVWADAGKLMDYSHVLLFDFHIANSHFTDQFAKRAFKSPVWVKKIVESLNNVFPSLNVDRIDIFDAPDGQEGKTGYIRLPGREPLSVDHFGDGIRHSFKVLASLVALAEVVDDEHPGLFLWEDPELFMHPATLGLLMKEVVGLVKERPIQAFFSTQSLDVLAWIGQMLNEKFLDSKSMNAYSLMLESNGELKNRLFQGEDIVSWMESGFDPRDSETAMIDLSPLSWRLKPSSEEEIIW